MKVRSRKVFIIAALAAIICLAALVPSTTKASANSAIRLYSGTTPSGIVVKDGDCPVVVEREDLHFELPTVDPDDILSWRKDTDEKREYNNYVRATYTLRNPSNNDAHLTLAFPFGSVPDYFDADAFFDAANYDITLDGVPVEKRLRHTFIENLYYDYEFSAERDLPRLRDDYVRDEFFNADTVVRKYSCYIDLDVLGSDRYLMTLDDLTYTADCRLTLYKKNDEVRTGLYVADAETLDIYTFGDEKADLTELVRFYEDTDNVVELDRHKKIDGAIYIKSVETMTADDLIFANYDDDGDISRVDYYNIIQDRIDGYLGNYPHGCLNYYAFDNSDAQIMRWFEYEISIAAGATVENSVTAPIYPDINEEYEPAEFTYKYLLSPAKGWAGFSNLNITIATPHYILFSSVGELESVDGVYTAKFDRLPEGELLFETCASQNPERHVNVAWSVIVILIIGVLVWFAVSVVATIITAIVLGVKAATRKNQ